jgi:hypothetical protein
MAPGPGRWAPRTGGRVQNHVGRPVRGENFCGRQEELGRITGWLQQNHVLLLAPRRVGKTSLMYKLAADRAAAGKPVVYTSAAGGQDSELALILSLYHEAAKVSAPVRERLLAGQVKRALGAGASFEAFGLQLALAGLSPSSWPDVGDELIDALRATDQDWLLLLDELPVFVVKLVAAPEGHGRAQRLLEWLRDARQGPAVGADRLRWLMAGSIGLDAVAQRLQLGATINDLLIARLGAFPEADARALLAGLSQGHALPLSAPAVDRLLARVGWLIPHHIQLAVHQLLEQRRAGDGPVDAAKVDLAINALEQPSANAYFDTWTQRLTEELGRPQDGLARALLGACARDPEGATLGVLDAVLYAAVPAEDRHEQRAYLLRVLENDGYIVEENQRWRFRSPLLRAWWLRRFA